MKYLIIVVLSLTMLNCSNKEELFIVNGKIENVITDSITIRGIDFNKKIGIKDGVFLDTLELKNKGYYTLYAEDSRVQCYFENNMHLTINFDTKNIDSTLVFEGLGASENNYLFEKTKLRKEKLAAEDSLFALKEDKFIQTMDGFKSEVEKLLEKNKLSESFIALERKNIEFGNVLAKTKYPKYYAHYAKDTVYKPSDQLKGMLKEVDLDNNEYVTSIPNYYNLVREEYYNEVYKETDDTITKTHEKALKFIKNKKSEKVQAALLTVLEYDLNPGNEDAKMIYEEMTAISKDQEYKAKLTEKYNKIQNLVKGKKSPAFHFENHAGGNTSLNDLKGKYVYIDVWATWCGPCIGEIPSLKRIEKAYHDKNITFVSISIDDKKDYDKWKAMVVDKELAGVQLIADDAWNSKFVKDYLITGIPNFILLDPNGNIVSANAPRPSDVKLLKLFTELGI